ncbi:hypothetical protein HII28_13535 [Planctomonas sp. JC2975]|uniref:DUF3846 domain-containing protein n=1 Tax=Planctomonas sp. JC2975 TaxID=2729626 RepID=UPI0014728C06|nr:hypothetical protein [Planctomonas sp. JC2975]NNC12893.1 hypothetical protein [Planctomonas sp. JC2975]
MLNGMLVNTEGAMRSVQVDDTNAVTLWLSRQAALGCDHLNVVRMPDGIDCWVDDEGLYRGGSTRS